MLGTGRRRSERLRRLGSVALVWTAAAATPLTVAKVTASGHGRPPQLLFGNTPLEQEELQLTRIVGIVARRGAFVECATPSEWPAVAPKRFGHLRNPYARDAYRGFVRRQPFLAVVLPPAVCADAAWLIENKRTPVWRQKSPAVFAWTVGTIAHEAMHVYGFTNEAQAECYGMQLIGQVSQMLGRSTREGRYLADLYWTAVYRQEPRAYRSPECRNNGRLDLRPHSDRWP